MTHLSNIYDPRLPDAKRNFASHLNDNDFTFDELDARWQAHLEWVGDNIIDKPKATEFYTSEQLQKMGMVGVYKK